MKSSNRSNLITIVFLFIFIIIFSITIFAQDGQYIKINDQNYNYSFKIPNDWELETNFDNPKSYQRLVATDPNQDYVFTIFALKNNKKIDLQKLTELDREIFDNLGSKIKSKEINKYLIFRYAVKKRYDKNEHGLYALAHYQVSGPYGYLIFTFSKYNDFSNINKIIKSFKPKVPLLEKVLARFGSPLIWMAGILIGLILIGLTYVLAKTGYLFRKGIMLKQELNKKEYKILKKDKKIKKVWKKNNNKAFKLIVLPVLAWIALFFLLRYFLPNDFLKATLILLLFPLLGYFGVFPTLSKNPFDYLL
ncbi:MAG: hypothetical protein K9K32_05180 [Halanaerobiales bacterium]|nr:hypothetical protein [Halanaerobiales bacterium]